MLKYVFATGTLHWGMDQFHHTDCIAWTVHVPWHCTPFIVMEVLRPITLSFASSVMSVQ